MFTGLCCMGMLVQRLENPSLRHFHKVRIVAPGKPDRGGEKWVVADRRDLCRIASSLPVGLTLNVRSGVTMTGETLLHLLRNHFCPFTARYKVGAIIVSRLHDFRCQQPHARMQLAKEQSGAVVKKLSPLSNASSVLQPNDVITHIAGKPIADDCTLTFRHDERISMQHAIRDSHIGDSVTMDILRNGEPKQVKYKLGHCLYKVPGLHGVDCWPSYFIYGAPFVLHLYVFSSYIAAAALETRQSCQSLSISLMASKALAMSGTNPSLSCPALLSACVCSFQVTVGA